MAEVNDETPKPRLTGEAAWKAHRDALDQRNAAVKTAAKERRSPVEVAAVERERRLDRIEADQLRALNERRTGGQ